MQDLRYDTLILSDLHLGSEISRAAEALDLLRNSSFNRLILLGDIFCDLDFGRLKKEHWHFLSSEIAKIRHRERAGDDDQPALQEMGHLKIIWMFFWTVLNSFNKRHFLRDQGYWQSY